LGLCQLKRRKGDWKVLSSQVLVEFLGSSKKKTL